MKYTLYSLMIATSLIAAQAVHADSSVSVGNDPDDDYTTIQSAIDASSSGWFISVDDGTYTEDLTIPSGKNITISGNPFDDLAVVIDGHVLIQDDARAQLDYLSVSTSGDYVVKVLGDAVIQYGHIRYGREGLLVGKGGYAVVYEEIIQHAGHNGVYVKPTGRLTFNHSRSSHNGHSGIRYYSHKKLRIADSQFRENDTGVYLIDASNTGNELLRTLFYANMTGMTMDNSSIYRADNQWVGNVTNVMEL